MDALSWPVFLLNPETLPSQAPMAHPAAGEAAPPGTTCLQGTSPCRQRRGETSSKRGGRLDSGLQSPAVALAGRGRGLAQQAGPLLPAFFPGPCSPGPRGGLWVGLGWPGGVRSPVSLCSSALTWPGPGCCTPAGTPTSLVHPAGVPYLHQLHFESLPCRTSVLSRGSPSHTEYRTYPVLHHPGSLEYPPGISASPVCSSFKALPKLLLQAAFPGLPGVKSMCRFSEHS